MGPVGGFKLFELPDEDGDSGRDWFGGESCGITGPGGEKLSCSAGNFGDAADLSGFGLTIFH
jgi:hypothetical protein